jgi:hypothetical protein
MMPLSDLYGKRSRKPHSAKNNGQPQAASIDAAYSSAFWARQRRIAAFLAEAVIIG